MDPLVSEILECNGGVRPWREHRALTVRVAFGGWAFVARCNRTGTRERDVRVFLHEQRTVLEDFPGPSRRGVFTPDRVRLEGAGGEVLAERRDPRLRFGSILRKLRWDDLDLLYFAGYALWNYLAVPWLFTWPGVTAREIGERVERGHTRRALAVGFPPGFATHGSRQVFLFDDAGRLRRHDYTPEPFARRARAAHHCYGHVKSEGVWFPSFRKVVPRRADGDSMPFPVLVWIRVRDVRFER